MSAGCFGPPDVQLTERKIAGLAGIACGDAVVFFIRSVRSLQPSSGGSGCRREFTAVSRGSAVQNLSGEVLHAVKHDGIWAWL